jgi:methionine aminotransferase
MSALAQEHGAVNLGQGFPDFDCDPNLIAAVHAAMQAGHNQYPPMAGIPVLRERIAQKIQALYGYGYDPLQEITITAGATQAILTAILCAVQPGDEVIVIEPAYDSYLPGITLAGGKAVGVPMTPPGETGHYRVDWQRVAGAITPRTRMILINSPHNPTGMILRDDDLRQLAAITHDTEILILADEVYEHMVYDGQSHASVSGHPELAARSFVISSFGKTFHVTGWKVAYCAAPAALMQEFRKVHQFNVFTVNTPMQHGIASYLLDPAPYLNLPAFYQRKRDLFRSGLQSSRFKLLPCDGTYFQLADYSAISTLSEIEFCRWLTTEVGVAAIPVSSFYDKPQESGVVRFCFAKQDQTLFTALDRLARL